MFEHRILDVNSFVLHLEGLALIGAIVGRRGDATCVGNQASVRANILRGFSAAAFVAPRLVEDSLLPEREARALPLGIEIRRIA